MRGKFIVAALFFLISIGNVAAADIFVISKQSVNIRSEPKTESPVLQKAHKGDWFLYLGSTEDNKWRNVELPNGSDGWIYYSLGRVEDENYLESLSGTTDISTPSSLFDIKSLSIHVINVRQGDCTLIVAHGDGNRQAVILFDAGKPGRGDDFVVPYLKSHGISKIKYVIASHFDSDHTGGLDEVLTYDERDHDEHEVILTGKAFIPKGEVSSSQREEYEEFKYAVKEQTDENLLVLVPPTYLPLANGITVQAVTGGGAYLDKGTGEVIDLEVNDANAQSIGLLVVYGNFQFFVAGDLGGQSKHKYIENKVAPYVGDIDVLRVSHHGSNTSTHDSFLSEVKPEVAIISVGSDNNYGHPRTKVIERLKQSNPETQIYQTEEGDQDSKYKDLSSTEGVIAGDIVIKTDGNCKYTVTGHGAEFSGLHEFTNDDCL